MEMKGDSLDGFRKEYNETLLSKARDSNGIIQEKYITVDTHGCTARLGEFIYGIVEEVH